MSGPLTKVEVLTTHHVRARAGRILLDLTISEENKVEDISIKIQRQDQGTPEVIGNIVELDLNDLAAAINEANAQITKIRKAEQAVMRGGNA